MYSFPNFEPVHCSMFSSNCCFFTCIQISQESGKVVWYSHLFKNSLQFVVIHTVKGFSVVNETEEDAFLEFSCFFHDPTDVGNLISGSLAFCIFHYIQNNNFTVLRECQKLYYNYLLCALALFFSSITKVGILLYRVIHQGIPNNQQLSMYCFIR